MLRTMRPANTQTRRRLSPAIAAALALSGAAFAGSAVITMPAQAKEKKEEEAKAGSEIKVSKGFAKVYQPVSDMVNAQGGDLQAAKGQLGGVEAAIENEGDRYYAGNLKFVLGNKLNDTPLRMSGVQMMLQSGMAPAQQVPVLNYVLGNLAYAAKDYGAARQAIDQAIKSGYQDTDQDPLNDPELIVFLSYVAENNAKAALDYLGPVVAQKQAAGQAVPEQWLLNALQAAYEAGDPAVVAQWSGNLVRSHGTAENWNKALRVVMQTADLSNDGQLDLLRLMRATDSLGERQYYGRYIELADERIRSNEILGVLQEGVDAGVYTTSDQFYTQVKGSADGRAAGDRTEAPKLAAQAAGAANGNTARNAADIYYTLGDYAKSAEMYKLAVDKGTQSRDRELTRLGMAQAMAGQYAAAQETLKQVAGPDKVVATMWEAYAASKA